MVYKVLADLVVLIHLAFILFAVLGGILTIWWRRMIWVHVPVVVWAVAIVFAGWICPLTPLENWLRNHGGGTAYASGFVEHYLLPILYPTGLTRGVQFALGVFVVAVNLGIYWYIFHSRYRGQPK